MKVSFGNHLAFLDHVKDFDRVKRDKFFEILQSKNILNLILESMIEIYSANKMKVKIINCRKNIQLVTEPNKVALLTHTI
jgi:hypothetical protein